MSLLREKEKKAWHITTATHNSRYSQRMFDNHVKLGKPVWLSEKEEQIVTETIAKIVKEDKLNIFAYNICGDHVHILLVCEKEELPKIVQKIKSMTARARNIAMGYTISSTREHAPLLSEGVPRSVPVEEHASLSKDVPGSVSVAGKEHVPLSKEKQGRGATQAHLWTQKFGKKEITTKEQLYNTIKYIRNNRNKHELPEHKGLPGVIKEMTCTPEYACRRENKGGFDVG